MRSHCAIRWGVHGVAVTLALACAEGDSRAQTWTGVTAEAVDNYCTNGQCSSIVCIAEADNYRNPLVEDGNGQFSWGYRWTNTSVYDTDFYDPDVQGLGNWYDDDTYNFDHAGNSTAYVCLHGTCNDWGNWTCYQASDCTEQGQGVCMGNGPPFSGVGHCAYYKDRLLIDSRDTSGNRYGGTVDYSTGHVKWGETSYVGGWAGAGTNGGINFGLLSNSCGVRWPYVLQQLGPIFAGMDVLGIVMPNSYGSDDVDAPVRGTALADAFVLGTQSSVGHAWADSIAGVPYNDGNPCPTGWQNYDYGGGHGMDGCGAQLTVTMDSSANNAFWDRDYQTWSGITIPSSGSQGNAYWAYLYECNYDCNTYPITLP